MHVISCPLYRKETRQPDHEWNVPFGLSSGYGDGAQLSHHSLSFVPQSDGHLRDIPWGKGLRSTAMQHFFYPKLNDPTALAY